MSDLSIPDRPKSSILWRSFKILTATFFFTWIGTIFSVGTGMVLMIMTGNFFWYQMGLIGCMASFFLALIASALHYKDR